MLVLYDLPYLSRYFNARCHLIPLLADSESDMVRAHVTKRIYTRAGHPESLPLWPFGLDQV